MRRDTNKLLKIREDSLISDYPNFISKLCLLIGAGMTIKSALTRILTDYTNTTNNDSKASGTSNSLTYCFPELNNSMIKHNVQIINSKAEEMDIHFAL